MPEAQATVGELLKTQIRRLTSCIPMSAGIIAFAFGDPILPEVQATVGGNAKKEMYKGISMGYSILLPTYMLVAIAGYWAYGFAVSPQPSPLK